MNEKILNCHCVVQTGPRRSRRFVFVDRDLLACPWLSSDPSRAAGGRHPIYLSPPLLDGTDLALVPVGQGLSKFSDLANLTGY